MFPVASVRRLAPGVLLRRLSGPLDALLACGIARRLEEGVIELHLRGEEIAEGGMAAISMRVPVRCDACAGAGGNACPRCGSRRAVDEVFSAWLAIPPGVVDGTRLDPSAQLEGVVRPVTFRVRT